MTIIGPGRWPLLCYACPGGPFGPIPSRFPHGGECAHACSVLFLCDWMLLESSIARAFIRSEEVLLRQWDVLKKRPRRPALRSGHPR
eukprot:3900410-Pyramimonas_sp.AAC.1